MYATLLWVHRWVALIASILICVLAITGSALVFEGAIDRGMHPELWHVVPATGATRLPIDTLIAHVHAAAPTSQVTGVTLSPADDWADVVQAGGNQIFVNPYSGMVLGVRTSADWNKSLPRRLHVLHVSLLSGKTGGRIVGIATAAAFFLVITGVIVWWREKRWRIRWSASWKRVLFDLHHTLGVGSALIIAIIAVSGMTIHYETLNRFVYGFDRTPAPAIPNQPAPPVGAAQIPMDSSYRVALAALPGARVMFLSMSPKADQPVVVAMRFPEDRTPGGRSRVYVDRFRGEALAVVSTRQSQMGTRMGNMIRSVHTGDLFGKPTEAIWLAAAIILAMQAITGVSMWWNGRRARGAVGVAAARKTAAKAQLTGV